MRVLLVVASCLVACGPPEEPGEWAALSPNSVTVVNGHLYGSGQFVPKRGERGAFGVMVVDAEALFIGGQELVAPSKDLRTAQVREWNTDPLSIRGGGVNGLIATESGGFARYSLANPKRPVVIDGGHVDAPLFDAAMSSVSDTQSLVSVGLDAVLLDHATGVVATATLPEAVCGEFALAPGDRAVVATGCGTAQNLQVLTATTSTLAFRTTRAMPDVISFGGLTVTTDGTVIAGTRGTKPSLHFYALGPNDELGTPRSLPLADADAPLRLRAVGTRALLFTANAVLLVDPTTPRIVSRLAVSETVVDSAPYSSRAEPGGTFVALAHGEGGLSLVQLDGDTLVHRGGFHHRWTDQTITLLSARKY